MDLGYGGLQVVWQITGSAHRLRGKMSIEHRNLKEEIYKEKLRYREWLRQRKKGKGSPYSITERRVPELIAVRGSQPAGDVSHEPGGRLPLLSARPAVTPTTLKRAATNFSAQWTEARWVWTVCLRLLPDSVATAIWTRALLRLSPAR